ncbi:MAG: carboxyl transferase domain-containing protein [Actinomycetota bacterium]|nr:carboxyl transferase domain-containing protein [Actinomycetota bacterium]
MRDYLVNKLRSAKALRSDASRPEAVKKVHSTDHLTARERTAILLDAGSEVEFGAIAAVDADEDWVPEKGGVDFIGTIDGETVITSSTDYTDRGGGYGAARLEHLISLAHQQRWPIAFFVDGGGSRARHPRAGLGHLELSGQIGRFTLFDGMAELSGWVPTVAIVSGPSFAGHASLAGFSDIVITTRGSAIGMGGPPMVEAALGLTLTPQELAGVEMHELTGGIDLLVDDEPTAIELAKQYLSYLQDSSSGQAHPSAESVAELVPESGPYDIYPVINAIFDNESILELRPKFASSVVTALARIEGRTVGVIANNPNVNDGIITEAAATKIGRFVELCDVYEYPIVSLIDSPYTAIETETGLQPGVSRWHTRVLQTQQHRSVPIASIQLRKAGGFTGHMMAGSPTGHSVPLWQIAWPTAELGVTDPFSATRNFNSFDDVIEPNETRVGLSRLLSHLPTSAEVRSKQTVKKHIIDTW